MISDIQYSPIFDGLWFVILGIIILLMFIATAVIPSLVKKKRLSLKWHVTMALISMVLLLVHIVLGMFAYFR